MMAFFLVMWICGQDQQVKRAVSYYFNDPFGEYKSTGSKKPSRMGSLTELANTGSVPQAESVAMGKGRNSYTQGESSAATKLVSDWLYTDNAASNYWREQAQRQRESVRRLSGVGAKQGSADEVAAQQLARQLREEFTRDIHQQSQGLHQDLLYEMISRVSWAQIAEDLLAQ